MFAVLTNRFHIALYPARFSSVTCIIAAGRAIAILHNVAIREHRDGFLWRSRIAVGGGVPAAAPLESSAGDGSVAADDSIYGAGGGDPGGGSAVLEGSDGDNGARKDAPARNHGVIGSHGHPPVAVVMAPAPPEGWFARSLVARAAATSAVDHQSLCHDLASHVWKNRGTYLAPYLR